jgi:cyclohexanecarboxylate-CoA ligase/acyl-CoA synthetase
MNATEQRPPRSDEYRAAGYWGDDTFVTLIDKWADADPNHPYVSDGSRELSYGEFRDQANRLATAFAALGVRPGDRVAVQLPNWSEYFLIYAACARLGAVVIPIVVVYRAGEVGFVVENAEAVGLITCGEFRGFNHATMAREVAETASSLLFRVVVRGEPTDGAKSLDELLTTQLDASVLPPPPSADDRHLILYSSGTESQPKGCLHTWNTSSFLPKHAVQTLGMTRSDIMFMPSPVTHALGLTLGLMAPTVAGASVHLLDVFHPQTALQRIGDYGCTRYSEPGPIGGWSTPAASASPWSWN